MHIKQSETILQIINKKQFLLEEKSDDLLKVLTSEESQRIINGVGEFRNRIYTPLKTIYTFIKQVLSSDKSCKNALSGLIAERLLDDKEPLSTNTGAYTKARNRLPEETVHLLVKSVGNNSMKKVSSCWKPYGRELKVFDGTTITLPDTKANNDVYPKHSNANKDVGFPQARLVAVLSLLTGSVVDYELAAIKGKGTGEISLLRSILACINENDIVVGDRLYCNYFLTYDLLKKNVDVVIPGHAQRRYDFRKGKRLGKKDHLTVWKKPRRPDWMSEEMYNEYANEIQIREFKVNGVVYVSTFLDPSTHPKNELHTLYKRRWEVELHLNSIKTVMGMNSVSCKTPEMVRKEIGIHFLAYNIIRELIVDACIHHDALPWQISFKATLQLLNQFTPRFSPLNKKKRAAFYSQMLWLIVKNKVGNRPGRVEPRAVRQRPKTFPVLKNTRKAEQQKLLKQRKIRMDKIATA